MQRISIILIMLCHLVFNACFVSAEEISAQDEIKLMKEQITAMQAKVEALEEKVASQQDQIANAEKVTPKQASVSKWTPEIGVVADTLLTLDSSKADTNGSSRLSLRELELTFGSHVDPFSRLDATVSFSDTESPSLEEAYLTRFGLPWDTTARIGKFKPKVGKVLGIHRDSLDTVDEPLVIQRYFGAEGMSKSGVDLTKTLNLPLPVTQQIVLGVIEGGNGEEGTSFGSSSRAPTVYSHLKNYLDLSDTTGLELGLSHMIGSRDENPGFESQVLAADFTLTKHLNANQGLKLQAEAFNLNRRKSIDVDGNLWGAYGLMDFRFHPQWSTGFRYDYAQLVDNPVENPHHADAGQTGYITFYQSEFARWRAQYTHKVLATGKDDNAVYLQGSFAIGDHKHKLQ